MKNILFASTLILLSGMFTSCSKDAPVEPIKEVFEQTPTTSTETEYQIQLAVHTSLTAPSEGDVAGQSRTIKLTGSGVGSSATFGEVETTSVLYYGLDDGKFYGTVQVDLMHSNQQLVLRVDDKISGSALNNLESQCFAAMTMEQFADMDFNGELCLTQFPDNLTEIGAEMVTFQISGTLK